MVRLDCQLLFEARRLINAANLHRMKELIFAYEQAVDLHNRGWGSHEVYQLQHELALRQYVMEQRQSHPKRRAV